MNKLIRNEWQRAPGASYERAAILRHDLCPEGLDVDRIRFVRPGRFALEPGVGHIASMLRGRGTLLVSGENLHLEGGVHLYLPPDLEAFIEADGGAELILVSAPSAAQSRGQKLLVRDERFLSACASGTHSLRWILTPQYLSRRIFLHHDPVLLSRSGDPVSWFHTTMFAVTGLPENEDGEPVFKMSYNSRTEFNVCYDVAGDARVRMALHPYRDKGQDWGPWRPLDSDCTYHLDEAAGGPEQEHGLRNKHEVYADGHVSLCCLFDPAPTGIERHRPGEYSDYEPYAEVAARPEYEIFRREMIRFDHMVDELSLAQARGEIDRLRGTERWALYEEGCKAQDAAEAALHEALVAESKGRDKVIQRWKRSPPR